MQDTIVTPIDQSTSKKMAKKYWVGMAVLVVVTLAGIGFGIFGMVAKGQTNDEVGLLNDELERKDEALKQAEEKLGTKIEIEPEVDTGTEGDVAANVSVAAAKDYIYIGGWGIKIKIPENLNSVSYVFDGGKEVLYVSGVVCGGGRCQYYPEFMEHAVSSGTGLGALSRYRKDDSSMRLEEQNGAKLFVNNDAAYIGGPVVYEDSEYYYVYSHGNALLGGATEVQWEVDSTAAVEDMLRHSVFAF